MKNGKLGLVLLALLVAAGSVVAQTTATNAVDSIESNVEYAKTTIVPLSIAGAVLFLGVAAAKKFWKRIFG